MKIVVLTGAGISQESGIKTFRDANGLWEEHRIEDVASPEAFERNPDLVHRFYNLRRRQLQDPKIQPNAAHKALADFAKNFAGDFLLVTQNVDDLHERAGSRDVVHMHGSLLEARCVQTGEFFAWRDDLSCATRHPTQAHLVGTLRPNIVWFGEIPMHMERIQAAVEKADLFVAIGTSGVVYPAAGFVQLTKRRCRRVEINAESTAVSSQFTELRSGPASQEVPRFFAELS